MNTQTKEIFPMHVSIFVRFFLRIFIFIASNKHKYELERIVVEYQDLGWGTKTQIQWGTKAQIQQGTKVQTYCGVQRNKIILGYKNLQCSIKAELDTKTTTQRSIKTQGYKDRLREVQRVRLKMGYKDRPILRYKNKFTLR